MPVLIQVTLGAGATQISKHGINFKQMIIQNNTSADTVRVGDSTVSSTKGILLTAGSAFNAGALNIQAGILSGYYLFGTAADVIDVLYEPA